MSLVVCKFGGTSLADGNNIRRAAEIALSDPSRKFVVVSAPGKRLSEDVKVTDLLYASYTESRDKRGCGEAFARIRKRFCSIVEELGMTEQVFYYCNSEEKVQEVLDRNPNAHAYCWSNSVTMRRMMRDDSERRFMVQLDGYTGNEKAWENSRNFGFIVSANLLWVNHSDLDEYGINQTYVDNILESGVVQVIHTDDPGGLVEYLAQKGRR